MKTVIFVTGLRVWSMGQGKGASSFAMTLKKYIQEGIEVYLLSDIPDNANYTELDKAHNIVLPPSCAEQYAVPKNRFFLSLCIAGIFRYIHHVLSTRSFIKEIEQILKTHSDVVLYAYEIHGVAACKYIAKKYNIPLVTRFQGTILGGKKNTFYNRIRRFPHFQALATEADLVIMTDDGTQGDKILAECKNSSRLLFLRNGLDLIEKKEALAAITQEAARKKIELRCREGEILFLTVSRLANWKHVDRAIEAFADYIRLGSHGHLIIVGDGEERENLEQLAHSLNVADKITFAGAVTHERVYDYMIAADIFLSFYDLSNVGNPLLEAMTLGLCIVTLDVGDTNKLVMNGKNGILLPKDSLLMAGEILQRLGDNPEKRNALGQAAKNYAEENFYSWTERMDIEYDAVSKLT